LYGAFERQAHQFFMLINPPDELALHDAPLHGILNERISIAMKRMHRGLLRWGHEGGEFGLELLAGATVEHQHRNAFWLYAFVLHQMLDAMRHGRCFASARHRQHTGMVADRMRHNSALFICEGKQGHIRVTVGYGWVWVIYMSSRRG
jgi:hypothetical protein